MTHDAINEDAKERTPERGASADRARDQHSGGCHDVGAGLWSVAASGLPVYRRSANAGSGARGRTVNGGDVQAAGQRGPQASRPCNSSQSDAEQDGQPGNLAIYSIRARTWVSGGPEKAVMCASNMRLIVCALLNLSKSMKFSFPIRPVLLANGRA
jgi:hypothetical protein